jgi:hypothetical protein
LLGLGKRPKYIKHQLPKYDLKLMTKDQYLKDGGYYVNNYFRITDENYFNRSFRNVGKP